MRAGLADVMLQTAVPRDFALDGPGVTTIHGLLRHPARSGCQQAIIDMSGDDAPAARHDRPLSSCTSVVRLNRYPGITKPPAARCTSGTVLSRRATGGKHRVSQDAYISHPTVAM